MPRTTRRATGWTDNSEAMIDLRMEGHRGWLVGEAQGVAAANAAQPTGVGDEQKAQCSHASLSDV